MLGFGDGFGGISNNVLDEMQVYCFMSSAETVGFLCVYNHRSRTACFQKRFVMAVAHVYYVDVISLDLPVGDVTTSVDDGTGKSTIISKDSETCRYFCGLAIRRGWDTSH